MSRRGPGFPTWPLGRSSPRSGSRRRKPDRTPGRHGRRPSSRDGQWVVNGSKIFITNAGTDISACVTITARTGEDEISNLVVPSGTEGYEVSEPMRKMGWRASDTRELSFRDCAVPEGNLLGERGAGLRQFLEILDGGRISVAAMGLGLAQGAFELASSYARERRQFGKPIPNFQAIQFKLADMATEIEAARGLVYKAAWLKDQGRPFAQAAAMAKLYTGELAHRVANDALQIHGGYGYMDEYAISRFYRDQKVLEIGEGTNEVQRLVIARHWACRARATIVTQREGRQLCRSYMDVHNMDGAVTCDAVREAHEKDLEVQGDHGVNYKSYWVAEAEGKIFCLVEAPDAETAAQRAPRRARARRGRDLRGAGRVVEEGLASGRLYAGSSGFSYP